MFQQPDVLAENIGASQQVHGGGLLGVVSENTQDVRVKLGEVAGFNRIMP